MLKRMKECVISLSSIIYLFIYLLFIYLFIYLLFIVHKALLETEVTFCFKNEVC